MGAQMRITTMVITTQIIEDRNSEDCNVEDVIRQSLEMMMSPFEPPAHMRVLHLDAMSTPEFPEYLLLYVNTLKGAMAYG